MNKKERILSRVMEHAAVVAEKLGTWDRIVFISLQGSQNYDLDYEGSDIDTKCVVLPTLDDIIENRHPISTTHVFENDEHCDIKDIRLMFDCYKKQNINFIETLFTDYMWVNPLYAREINYLLLNRESIAVYCQYRAVKCMKGMVLEKRHALQHEYPSKIDVLNKYGYDPKQLHHIVRLYDFMTRYCNGDSYKTCLIPSNKEYVLDLKTKPLPLDKALEIADEYVSKTVAFADWFCNDLIKEPTYNEKAEKVLHDCKYHIMVKSFKEQLMREAV